MAISRRDFIKWSAAAGTWLYVSGATGATRFLGTAYGATPLAPGTIPKYATPLLVPPVMPKAATVTGQGGKPVDYYEVSMRQIQEQILPAPSPALPGWAGPATTVWGYGAVKVDSKRGSTFLNFHHAPSLTIEAKHGRPVRVKWINDLVDANGGYLPHLLPVDPTLHWANPGGAIDTRPTFAETPGPYTGPVPIVTHVHGAVGVGDDSDGYPEAWFLPAADNLDGYTLQGTWYDFFAGKALTNYGTTWTPGSATFQYPNMNRASTIWYHDHTLGMTRLNVYAGPAGFYLIRGGPDDVVLDSRTATAAVLPGPAPKENDKFPPNKTYYEIPIAIQDRAFNDDGSLFYPDSRAFFDGATALDPGYIPNTDLSPIWNPEYFGNTIMVNGNTWPFQTVEQRRYRIRFLNGCQSRFLILDFSAITGAGAGQGVEAWQIGNEGGLLAAPVNLTAANGNRLLMGPAERADIILDFTNVPVGSYVLGNVGPDEPFGGGIPGVDFPVADPATTGQIMQFNVVPALVADPTTPPMFLQLPAIVPVPAAAVTRQVALLEVMSMVWDGPAEAILGTVDMMGNPVHQMWMHKVTETPTPGTAEIWEMYNTTPDAHPMHIHEVVFQVLDREPLVLDDSGEPVRPFQLSGTPRPPDLWESGFKDTVVAYPGEVTRVTAHFANAGQFVWHCHIVEHEDNEMMRPMRIGGIQPGQPPEGPPPDPMPPM